MLKFCQDYFGIETSCMDNCNRVLPVIVTAEEVLVPARCLLEKCIFMTVDDNSYLARFPNRLTQD